MTLLEEFTQGYIACALWTSFDDSYQGVTFAPGTKAAMVEDCTKFWNIHYDRITDPGQAGRDFWLTRNGHGAGFWDGDYPEHIGEILTEASHGYGSFDLYIDENGLVCHF